MYNCALRGSRPTLLIKVLSICLFLFVAQVVPVTWRLMPLGDSKSEGTSHDNCWRYYLSEKLNENGFTDMDFVGPHAGTYSDDDTWWDSESACFYSANSGQVLNGGLPRGRSGLGSVHDWAPAYQPNLAIIHLGTNDIRGGAGTSTIIARLKGIIDVLRASDPTIKVIVAQIPTWDFSAFGGSANAVMSLNNAVADLPSYSTTHRRLQSWTCIPITHIRQWTRMGSIRERLVRRSLPTGSTRYSPVFWAPHQTWSRSTRFRQLPLLVKA